MHQQMSQQAPRFVEDCPGWADALSALRAAAERPLCPEGAAGDQTAIALPRSISQELESGISALLLWAQSARLAEEQGRESPSCFVSRWRGGKCVCMGSYQGLLQRRGTRVPSDVKSLSHFASWFRIG